MPENKKQPKLNARDRIKKTAATGQAATRAAAAQKRRDSIYKKIDLKPSPKPLPPSKTGPTDNSSAMPKFKKLYGILLDSHTLR